jgi:hypothetical protein
VSEDDLTVRVAGLAAVIEQQLAKDEAAADDAGSAKSASSAEPRVTHGPWLAANSLLMALQPDGVYDDIAEVINYGLDPVLVHAARQDPARVLRRVKATRDLVADILGEPHYTAEVAYYSCSQAQEGAYLIAGPTGPPGSGCGDPERAGRPCDCGRDAKVARMLAIIAGEWETS